MAIEKVRAYFRTLGIEERILEFDVSSATVELAAAAVGVEGARICKTLSFKSPQGCILIQMAGDARVNNRRFKEYFGYKAKMLSPEEAEFYTGHAVGGICAFGIEHPDTEVYCDVSLQRFETVFPACGSANSAVEMTCDELYRISGAKAWIDISKLPEQEQSNGTDQ